MSNETILQYVEHAASGYGADRDVVITIPHVGDLPPTKLVPSLPPRVMPDGSYRFGCDSNEDRVWMRPVWVPERHEWVGIEVRWVDEGWRGYDESITGPYRLTEPFLAALPRTGPSATTPSTSNESSSA